MQNSKLFKILKQLNDEEKSSFRKFVASPYFNTRKNVTHFYDIILSKKLLDKSDFDGDMILEKLYGDKTMHERMLHDLTYHLMNLLEEFLSLEKYRKNTFQQKINLMVLAYEKEMEPLIPGIERDLDQMHTQSQLRDSNYLYETFMIHSERDYSFRLSGKITNDDNLLEKSANLDLFYLALKLKDNCEILNRSNILSTSYDDKIFSVITEYLLANPNFYEPYPAIDIYLHIYLMLSQPDHENYFMALKPLVIKHEKAFTIEELRSIYTYMQNYCIRRCNMGNTAYYKELFGLYQNILASGLVFGDNKNMQWDFKNFVSLGLRLKEYDWTLKIINMFKEKLPETIKANAYGYNLANYYYETQEYKKATRLLNTVDFTDIYYSLGSKAMLLKIYYELGEEESFYSLVSSFGIYLRRNKLISKENAEIYNNLLLYAKKAFMLKSKLPYQRKKSFFTDVEALHAKIGQVQKIANIDWLLGEVEALGAKF